MPQIMVVADRPGNSGEGPIMLRERVNAADFESDHFAAMLVERLGWAVSDALEAEHSTPHEEREEEDYLRSASVVTTAS
jgi:hypothetical protein